MPTDIEQHNNQQTDADHGIHLKKGLVDPGKVVGTNERVLDDQKRVVGLLYAGSDTTTLFNPIQDVLTALNVEIVT